MNTVPDDLRYAASHEWIKVEGANGIVGITDHAQHELSDVVYVDLPKVGATMAKGAVIAVIESVKAASDIYAPASGEVIEINNELITTPELINKDPYGAAWLFKLKLADPAEVDSLKNAADYREQISG